MKNLKLILLSSILCLSIFSMANVIMPSPNCALAERVNENVVSLQIDSENSFIKTNEVLIADADAILDDVESWWDKVKNWFADRWEDIKNWWNGLPDWAVYCIYGGAGLIVVLIIWSIFKPKRSSSASSKK